MEELMGERGEVYSDKLFTNSDRTYFLMSKKIERVIIF
ncbi:Hypothetical protein BHY_0048 [Borrelia nietonii YOR]|uniref:Uncharacterized protein n=1 Tax=Borrelia nietonii YOR TaxID=1293576 RepID=A0ABN4C8G1_9SPIR|nr:Hypothetical protein BHY_0048 [Borrelia nietonii YOR]